jgi:membrane-associated phospholipid phosphatase
MGMPSWGPAPFSIERVPLALRLCAPTAFTAASAVAIARSGFPASPDRLWPWLGVALLSWSVVSGVQQLIRVLVEWLPLVAAILIYDLLRGAARGLLPTHALPQIWFGAVLGRGTLPPHWLQEHLWDGPAHLHWYDYATFGVYMTHFVLTPILAALLYVFSRERFRRYTSMVVLLALSGVVTYALLPAVPPWLASRDGLIPPVTRVIPPVTAHIPYIDFNTLYESGERYANAVAAIPSLHAGYAMLAALALGACTRRWWLRSLLALYPLAMGFALVYSGEHYTLDVLLGWLYAGVVFAFVTRRFDAREAVEARASLLAAADGRASRRLARRRALDGGRDPLHDGRAGGDGDRVAVMGDLERGALQQRVRRLRLGDLDLQSAPAEEKAERESLEARRNARREREHAVVVAHAAEAGDGRDPRASERGDVEAVAGVVLDVVQVHERGLAEVVVRELEVPDLRGDHSLRGG